jgi:hypothetical protein
VPISLSYTTPSGACVSQLMEARAASLRAPTGATAAEAAPAKAFDTVPSYPADGITMRQAAAADQAGFGGEYLSLLQQTDVFRKPFPGDPMLNQHLEKHYTPLLPRPLKPRCVILRIPLREREREREREGEKKIEREELPC